MTTPVVEAALDQLFRSGRTYSKFLDRAVPDDLLRQAWDLARMGPTAANSQPMRVVFVRSPEAKARLKPALAAGNVDKTMAAPVTAIVGTDMEFYDQLPKTFPQVDARSWYAGNAALIAETAFRNSSLQGGYLVLALRALGLDCGPMSGFNAAKVEEAFFAGTSIKANFLINIGYGDASGLHARNPRLDFDEACVIA
ncbi:MAG TPA: malonic semialdehyde reductase [Magnetospirillum sp.]|nr:malonic semialdehyde reductase [Magnetospirillum sp.]